MLTAKLMAMRIIAAIAVRNDWELKQTDVDMAYLNASLKENIYMREIKGFKVPSQEDNVIHLKQAIYRLRQTGHEWYEDLMSTLTNVGFQRCKVEQAMFYQFDKDATILVVDVDNITITGNSPRAIKQFKDNLSLRYSIKYIGSLQWLLGIGIERDREKRTISFSQTTYIQMIIECFRMEEAKPLPVPLNPGHNLSKSQLPSDPQEIEEMRCIPYREAI